MRTHVCPLTNMDCSAHSLYCLSIDFWTRLGINYNVSATFHKEEYTKTHCDMCSDTAVAFANCTFVCGKANLSLFLFFNFETQNT